MCGAHEEVQYPVRSKLTIEFRCEVSTTRSNLLAPNKTTFLIAPMDSEAFQEMTELALQNDTLICTPMLKAGFTSRLFLHFLALSRTSIDAL